MKFNLKNFPKMNVKQPVSVKSINDALNYCVDVYRWKEGFEAELIKEYTKGNRYIEIKEILGE